ncbi:MAG: hypothetical protein ABSF71_36265 [Terriglobia bacterium]
MSAPKENFPSRPRLYTRDGDSLSRLESKPRTTDGYADLFAKITSRLLPFVAGRMGCPVDEVKSRLKGVQRTEDLTVNACAYTTDAWKTFEIRVNEGLLLFLIKFAKLFTANWSAEPAVRGWPQQEVLDAGASQAILKRLIKAYFNNTLQLDFGVQYSELSKLQLQWAAGLAICAMHFVVAHEFGHIIQYTRRDLQWEQTFARSLDESFFDIDWTIQRDRENTMAHFRDETTADLIGLDMILKSCEQFDLEAKGWEQYSAAAGCETLLCGWSIIERCLPQDPTHPPTRSRRKALRLIARLQGSPLVNAVGESLEAFTESMLSGLQVDLDESDHA